MAPAQREAAARRLLHSFASFGYGGVPIRICDVINGLGGAFRHTVVALDGRFDAARRLAPEAAVTLRPLSLPRYNLLRGMGMVRDLLRDAAPDLLRSEEHTSELQSLMRISYAVFCLKK